MNNSVVRWCDRIIRWGIPALGVCIALAISMPSYTSLLIKATFLQCGIAVISAAWVIRTVEERRFSPGRPLLWFVIPAFVFMLSAVFNYIFVTPSRDTSIDELLIRVPYFLLFFIAAVSFTDHKSARNVLTWIMGAGFVVSFYGVLQHFGVDPFDLSKTDRIRSTFGHPNFYAGFLILAIPMVAAAFDYTASEQRKKTLSLIAYIFLASVVYYLCVILFTEQVVIRAVIFVVFCALLIILCIRFRFRERSAVAVTLFFLVNNVFMTGSRSAQIGLGSAVIVFSFLVYVFVLNARSWRKALSLAVIALSLAGLVVAGVRHISYSSEGRLNIVSQRKYYVQGALDLIKQKPLLGHGLGTFKNNFPLVKPRASWLYNEMCFEHVSNVYNEHLEVLHDEGAVGFSAYVWLLAVFLIAPLAVIRTYAKRPLAAATAEEPLWLRAYPPDRALLLIGFLSGVSALLISNIFSLSMRYTATGFMFWLFLGLIAAQASAAADEAGNGLRQPAAPVSAIWSWTRRAFQAAAVIIAGTAVFFSCRLYAADLYLNEAVGYSKSAYVPEENNDRVFHGIFVEGTRYRSIPAMGEKALEYYMKTLRCNPRYLRARYFLGNTFNRRWNMKPECNPAWGDRLDEPRNDAQRALEQYEYIYRQAPHLSEIDYEMGDLYRKLGNLDMAVRFYREYIRYMPFFTKAHYALAQTYAAKGDWANAAEEYKESIDLNSKFTLAFLELSAVYTILDKSDLAEEMFEKARELVPERADFMMAGVWENFGEKGRAAGAYQKQIERDSTDAAAYYKLGWYYIERKELKKAIAVYLKLVKADPSSALGYINLSNLYYETGQLQASKDALRKAIELNPELVRSMTSRPPTYNPD